ncbi:MAG: hypothetical protein P1Q69_20640 [Candidatus Thorarchaeota archaeon]|nr:hypothetical protein [Candidatus Thorarchaeota archaeon]
MKGTSRFKTFVTEQKMLLFTQIAILIGLGVEIGMFFALLLWGRPPGDQFELIFQFFGTAALWVMVINIGVVLFWWVSGLGPWSLTLEEDEIVSEGSDILDIG